jgi:hypothetical protein
MYFVRILLDRVVNRKRLHPLNISGDDVASDFKCKDEPLTLALPDLDSATLTPFMSRTTDVSRDGTSD